MLLSRLARASSLVARRPTLLQASPVLQTFRGAGTFIHHDHAENSVSDSFDFDEESEKEIAFTLSKYPETLQGRQSAIMPMLWIVQQQLDKAHPTMNVKHADPGATPFPKSQGGGGWVPIAAMHKIAERLGCSHMDVYEVSTFFTMYNREKLGKFHIQLCATTPCMVCGAYDIMCARRRTHTHMARVRGVMCPLPHFPPSRELQCSRGHRSFCGEARSRCQ
jgi:NADH dehydrogenase (ubiquinone) flavoprotein 2